MTATMGDRVSKVRAFNRFYTNVIGALRDDLLHTPYSLTEARVIFELSQHETVDVADLRRGLDIDAGYLSRVLTRFEADGLITRERSTVDGRRQVIGLTDQGRTTFADLDERSATQIQQLLGQFTDENQRRLITSMEVIRDVLQDTPRTEAFVLREPQPGDFGWVVARHGALYAEEYGWDSSFEALVARVVADYIDHRDPRREAAWIAEVDGAPMGCVFCMRKEDDLAQLRLLLVDPRTRGMGVGARLVQECLRFARRSGYQRITLWTNDVLHQARRIYQRAGFELVEQDKHHSFGHDLVGQHWIKDLAAD